MYQASGLSGWGLGALAQSSSKRRGSKRTLPIAFERGFRHEKAAKNNPSRRKHWLTSGWRAVSAMLGARNKTCPVSMPVWGGAAVILARVWARVGRILLVLVLVLCTRFWSLFLQYYVLMHVI